MNLSYHQRLKLFFGVSIKIFEIAKIIKEANGLLYEPSEMELLHQKAFDEVLKETPNDVYLDELVQSMEALAERNRNNGPSFATGGFIKGAPESLL